jgi:hypothetical protein
MVEPSPVTETGMIVAEGTYLVTVAAVDSSGNRATSQLLTHLEY